MTKSSAQHSAHNLSECEEKIGYRFGNQGLLRMALTHSSCANTHLESNERLEFLGDAALGLVVSNALFPIPTDAGRRAFQNKIVCYKS